MFLLSPLYIKLWAAVSVRGILSFKRGTYCTIQSETLEEKNSWGLGCVENYNVSIGKIQPSDFIWFWLYNTLHSHHIPLLSLKVKQFLCHSQYFL